MRSTLWIPEQRDLKMPIAETKNSLWPIRRETTKLEIEMDLYSVASVDVSLFSRHYVRLQHYVEVLNIHTGLISPCLLQAILFC